MEKEERERVGERTEVWAKETDRIAREREEARENHYLKKGLEREWKSMNYGLCLHWQSDQTGHFKSDVAHVALRHSTWSTHKSNFKDKKAH